MKHQKLCSLSFQEGKIQVCICTLFRFGLVVKCKLNHMIDCSPLPAAPLWIWEPKHGKHLLIKQALLIGPTPRVQ